jgi:hypothetical protein
MLTNLRTQACPTQTDCDPVLGEAVTDEEGFATLDIDLTRDNPSKIQPEFYGFIRAIREPESEFQRVSLFRSGPFLDHGFGGGEILSRQAEEAFAARLGLPFSRDLGVVTVEAFDCTMSWATGLRFEFWRRDSDGYRRCDDDCRARYYDDQAIPTQLHLLAPRCTRGPSLHHELHQTGRKRELAALSMGCESRLVDDLVRFFDESTKAPTREAA